MTPRLVFAYGPPVAQLPLGLGRTRAEKPARPARNERRIYSVSELGRALGETLQTHHPSFWVAGEISGLRRHGPSGHCYFDLKDRIGKLSCVIWSSNLARVRFELHDGLSVLCHAKTTVFPRSGRLQLSVFHVEPQGLGALYAELEARKNKLLALGLMAAERKRPLPPSPETVGLVTSREGAAFHDVLRTLWRRDPSLTVIVAPTRVQGRAAAPRIAHAVRQLDALGRCDVLIVARGGGSLEDLWAFNEESVARAIADSGTPVVVGVGHETDVTLADLVSDHRASTPTAAAEAVAPDRAQLARSFEQLERRLLRAMGERVRSERARLHTLDRALRHPAELHAQHRGRLEVVERRLAASLGARLARARGRLRSLDQRLADRHPRLGLERQRSRLRDLEAGIHHAARSIQVRRQHRLTALAGRLEALSPLAVLARGFALVTDEDGHVVRRSEQLRPGDRIGIRLSRGRLVADVRSAESAPETNDE